MGVLKDNFDLTDEQREMLTNLAKEFQEKYRMVAPNAPIIVLTPVGYYHRGDGVDLSSLVALYLDHYKEFQGPVIDILKGFKAIDEFHEIVQGMDEKDN